MAGWAAAAQAAMEMGTAWMNSSSQHNANRMNLRIARENRDWTEKMSDSAVRRRAYDIEQAGGNRALAFTNGQEATTPSVTPARMEPTRLNAPQIGSAVLMAQQLKNMKAEEYKTTQEGRGSKIAADLAEGAYPTELNKRVNRNIEEYEWDDLETEIRRSRSTSSAAQAKRWEETVDSLIATARQQQRAGKIDLDALENIAKIGGVEANQLQGIISIIMRLITK